MNDATKELQDSELNTGMDSDLKLIKEDGVTLAGPRDAFSGPSDPGNGGHGAVASAT